MPPLAAFDALPAAGTSLPGNAAAWQAWNYNYTTSISTPANTLIWQQWNTVYSSATSITLPSPQLYASTGGSTLVIPAWTSWNTVYTETREQREARELRQVQQRQRDEETRAAREVEYAERRRVRAVASARAEELLLSLLSPEQARTWREHGWFEVQGSRGGRWRIRNRGQSGNVDLMPEIGQERLATYCAHPPDGLPDADAHLAQMLHLATDEDGFRRVANVRWVAPGARVA